MTYQMPIELRLQLEEAAERGATHLDDVRPNWYDVVEPDTLVMSSCYTCVIGQLTGSYNAGVGVVSGDMEYAIPPFVVVGSNSYWTLPGVTWATEHGFSLPRDMQSLQFQSHWEALTDIWRDKIKQRRAGV